MAVEWHPEENALYEIDEDCTRFLQGYGKHGEEPVLNYFTLLLCLFYA